MIKYSTETKGLYVKKVLTSSGTSLRKIAQTAGIPPSTLKDWVKQYQVKAGISVDTGSTSTQGWTQAERFKMLVESSNLAPEEVGAYCRKQGIYQEQLKQWERAFMQPGDTEKAKYMVSEIKALRAEIKALKRDIGRKDKALAETTALLVLKKKLTLLCADSEDDTYR